MSVLRIKKDKFKTCDEYASISFFEYSSKMNDYTNRQIRNIYYQVFKRECNCSEVWAKYQIHYELARQYEVKRGNLEVLSVGSTFREAYKGTMSCDITRTGATLRTLIPYELSKETKMSEIKKDAKKVSKCVGRTLGLGVYATWVHVFKENAKNRKSDEEITKFLLSEFPDHQIKSFHAVHACRINYNNGRYTDGIKPTVKSVRYLADGSVWKRGHKATPASVVTKKPAAKKLVVKKSTTAKKSSSTQKKTKAVAK